MNAEAVRLRRQREAERDALGGEAPYRLHVLKHLRLKTVVKESHCTPVHQMVFNHTHADNHNMFATVGKDQATVYDDLHMGDFIGVVVHFVNNKTEHVAGGELSSLAWLDAEGLTEHPYGDAWLAVSGADPAISVISVVEHKVIKMLTGHSKEVTDLAAVPSRPGMLASLARDGNLRLWDVPSETCLASHASDATCLAVHPDPEAGVLVTGGRKGALTAWQLPPHSKAGAAPAASKAELTKSALKMAGTGHTEAIDCMRFLPGNRLATKSCDGRMFVWDFESKQQLSTWKIPSCNPSGALSSRCQFNSTPDGAYICGGNTNGDVYVWDTTTGTRITHVSPVKVTGPVRSCTLSADCRHLLAAVGPGFIFRFEYRRPDDLPVEDKENASATANEQDDGQAMEEGS